jgi:hypothetical protein
MSENLGQQASLENYIGQASKNGWAFFENDDGERMQPPSGEPDRLARLASYAAAFYAQPEFCELLEFLCEQSLHRARMILPPIGVDPMQNYAYGCFREGQNSMVMTIFKMIADGRSQELKGRDA